MTEQPGQKASVEKLADLIASTDLITVFSGAGMSTESGIPDYRSPDGIWSRMQPITYQQFVSDEAARLEDWRRRFIMNDDFAIAQPNQGYGCIDTLYKRGQLHGIITQNIDGLHKRGRVSGERIVELHGNATFGRCLECSRAMELEAVRGVIERTGACPRCESCGGLVKVAVISFGQNLDPAALQRAAQWSADCELFLVLGSSLVVEPAASLPRLAASQGATLAIINREHTPLDNLAACIVRGSIGSAFTQAVSMAS
ncbi:MAG: Sir2 family NAD-dependent protein deacetylase [Pseudomonadota bacterium]